MNVKRRTAEVKSTSKFDIVVFPVATSNHKATGFAGSGYLHPYRIIAYYRFKRY
jgi:hypothetical protein